MDVLDYESPCPTFALAFSPLGPGSSASKASVGGSPNLPDIKLAVGSFVESLNDNHVTIVGLDPSLSAYDLYDDMSSSTSTPSPVAGMTGGGGGPSSMSSHFQPLAKATHLYPVTAVSFSPPALSESLQASAGSGQGPMIRTREMLATSSDCIRLWDFAHGEWGEGGTPHGHGHGMGGGYIGRGRGKSTYKLLLRSQLANHKEGYSAPLTSFSWSHRDPSLIVTSSIDTTCTVWDISSSTAITQLIAHDREVYDVCWSSASRDVFASVGADGSVRTFDLRSLDHSTILFESPPPAGPPPHQKAPHLNPSSSGGSASGGAGASGTSARNGAISSPPLTPAPLLRLKFNPADPNYIAVSSSMGTELHILDVRVPGVPVADLRGHSSAVNGMAWSGEGMVLGTCGDDCQVLVWDLSTVPPSGSNPPASSRSSTPHTKHVKEPALAYNAPQEVNAITWSEAHRDRVAIGLGRKVRVLRV